MAHTQPALPATPAGEALGRLLTLLGAPTAPATADLDSLFAPELLSAAGPEAILSSVRELQPLVAQGDLVRAGGSEDWRASATYSAGPLLIRLSLALDPSTRLIADLDAAPSGPSTGVSWQALLDDTMVATTSSTLDESLTSVLSTIASDARASQRLPGLLAAVADSAGTLLWTHSAGAASLSPRTAPSSSTVLQIGSITKTMTAVMVMQLVEQGLVSLDEDINAYLRSYSVRGPKGEVLPVRSLLTHTSGLGARPGVELSCPLGAEPGLADFYGPELVGQHSPGSTFTYSNDAFGTLGQLIADVSGVSLVEHADKSLFAPLGMTNTTFDRSALASPAAFQGLDVDAEELASIPMLSIIPAAAGAVVSTLNDMALYAAMMHGRGANSFGRVLSEESFTKLVTPHPEIEGVPPGFSICLAWLETTAPGARMWWHNGGWYGAKSELGVMVDSGHSVLVFTNTYSADVDTLCMQLAGALAERA